MYWCISVLVCICRLVYLESLSIFPSALEVCSDTVPLSKSKVDRWCGEPLKTVVIPTDVFVPNKRGYPVLSKIHQAFMERVFRVSGHTHVHAHTHTHVNTHTRTHTHTPLKTFKPLNRPSLG